MHIKAFTINILLSVLLLTACASAPQPSPSQATAPPEQAAQDEEYKYTCVDEETANLPLVSEYLKVFPIIISDQFGARYQAPQEISKALALELAQTRALDALEIIIKRLKQDNVTPYLLEPEPDQPDARQLLLLMAQDERQRVKPSQMFAHPLTNEQAKAQPLVAP